MVADDDFLHLCCFPAHWAAPGGCLGLPWGPTRDPSNASRVCRGLVEAISLAPSGAVLGPAGACGASATATAAGAVWPSREPSALRVDLRALYPKNVLDAGRGALGTKGAAWGLRVFVLQVHDGAVK